MPRTCTCTRPAMLLAAACGLATTAPAAALTSATLTATDLARRQVRIHRLGEDLLGFFDESRKLVEEPVEHFVRIDFEAADDAEGTPSSPGDGAPRTASVRLVDGQRIVGAWRGVASGGQAIRLEHSALGVVTIEIDRIRLLSWSADGQAPADPSVDRIALRNGDRLEGFVAALRDDAVEVTLADQAQPIVVPLGRVTSIALANPVRPTPSTLDRVAFHDGTTVLATRSRIESDQLSFAPAVANGHAQAVVKIGLSKVARLELRRSGHRLVDLASLPRQVMTGAEVFGVPMPPRIDGGHLWLHAPLMLRVDLPPGATRFAAVARLDDSRFAAGAAAWADLVLRIFVDGDLRAEQRLHAGAAEATINIEADGALLQFEADPANHGPILDRLVLHDAVVLIHAEEDAR